MKKIIERSTPTPFVKFALLLAALSVVVGFQPLLHADTHQPLFDKASIKDPGSLIVKLQDPRAPVSKLIASQLSEDMQWVLVGYDGASEPSAKLQNALLSALNQLLEAGPLYDAQLFADIQLSESTQGLVAQNPQSGEALVRLNRLLLSDVYPYELAALSVEQTDRDFKGIETCRENLRQIKIAWDNYRASNADAYPEWLSELSPQYIDEKMILCPADATEGVPGVLTEDTSDPTLPCSYLYEIRPSEKTNQEFLQAREGNLVPIIRCEHHRLNLSFSGKLYRNGPQRDIYNSNKMGVSALADVVRGLRKQHGEAFLKTQEGRENLKQAIEELVLKQFVPKLLSAMEKEVFSQLEAQLGADILKTPMGMDILNQVIPQVENQIREQLQAQLEAQLGADFFTTKEGKDILQQLSVLTLPGGTNQIKLKSLIR